MNPAPRRLVLSAVDFESLVRRAGVRLPPGFDREIAPGDGGPLIPALAVNLGVLARPDLLVRVDADLPSGVSRAVFAVAGRFGASLFALADRAVELSMFSGPWLGPELIRAVPEQPAVRIRSSLAPDAADPDWAGRRVGRTALAEYGPTRRLLSRADAAEALGLDAADAEFVAELTDATRGTLRAFVHGRPHGPDHGVLVGQVVWVATDAGWYELAPSDVDEVELVPVTREAIGTRLAPMIAQVLAEVDDDAA